MVLFKTVALGFILLLVATHDCSGQGLKKITIHGQVIDEVNGQPIAFATVAITEPNASNTVEGTVTDDNGNFKLMTSRTDFGIQINYVGYATVSIVAFEIIENKIDLKVIKLKEELSNLDAVVIEVEKTRLVNTFGKQILYVGSDISSAGNSSLAILDNFPSVFVGLQGEITVRGNANVIIHINGKPTSKDGQSLKNLPADLVERIELITNPSAEYGAEGIAGIINIILKRNKKKGFNLTANGSIQGLLNPLNFKHGLILNTNYNIDDFNFFFNGGYTSTDYENSENSFQDCISNDCEILKYTYRQFEDGLQRDYTMNFGWLWNTSYTSTLEMEGSYLRWNIDKNGLASNNFLFDTNNIEEFELRNFGSSIKEEYELMTTYINEWNSKDKLMLQLRHVSDTWNKSFQNNLDNAQLIGTSIENTIIRNSDIDRDTDYLFDGKLTLKKDYGELVTGFSAQLSYNDLKQNIDYSTSIVLPTNDFKAKSSKNAVFAQLKNEKVKLKWQVGFRLEHLSQNFTQQVDDVSIKRDYLNIFPSGILEYKISDDQMVSLNYSNRINYPRLTQLNPYEYFTSPLSLRKGNTGLEPSTSNNIEATYSDATHNIKWTNTLFANFSKNLIRTRLSTALNGFQIQQPINDGNSISAGYELSLTANPYDWLKLIYQGTFYYKQFSATDAQFNNQLTGRLRFIQELKFKNNLKIQLKQGYDAPSITQQRRELDEFYMDISIQEKINERLAINASFTDIFGTKRIVYENRTDNFRIIEDLRFQFQRIKFSLIYKLKD